MTINFILPFTKRNTAKVYVRIRTNDKSIVASTPEKVSPADWNKDKGRFKDMALNNAENKAIKGRLETIGQKLLEYVTTCQEAGRSISAEEVNNIIALAGHTAPKKQERIPKDIGKYLDWLIEKMKAGEFKNGSEAYDADTIKVWITFKNMFAKFSDDYLGKTGKLLTWNGIDKGAIDAFVKYMDDFGFLVKTQNKYLTTLKAAIGYSMNYHNLHDNSKCLKWIRRKKETEGCTTAKTYLNADEVQALYEMPLAPGSLKAQVRDVFLVGVYTCQRCSDYNNLSKSNFGTTASGRKVIRLVQEKTNRSVTIPVLNDNLLAICEKYDYQIPHIKGGDVILNRYLKRILKELAASVPSLNETFRTILTLPEKRAEEAGTMTFERDEEGHVIKHKYDLISTHSARRSGITNLYKSRIFTNLQIMSISGHASEKVFREYLSQSSDEIADELAKIAEEEKKQKEATSNEYLF